jgi:hypothetical protein
MFARVHPYVSKALDAELDRRVFDAIRKQVAVVPSTCGVGSPLLGAAERAWESVLNDPAAASRRRTSTTTP